MDKIIEKIDDKNCLNFEKSIKEILSIYLVNSAKEQGLIDSKTGDYIIRYI